jgi:hypothetical protein
MATCGVLMYLKHIPRSEWTSRTVRPNWMGSVMPTSQRAIHLDVELPVTTSSGFGVDPSAGSPRGNLRSCSQRVMLSTSARSSRSRGYVASLTPHRARVRNIALNQALCNQASIALAHNPVGHTRVKQMNIRFHYIREVVKRSVLSIEYVKTTAMLADGLTKPSPPVTFAPVVDMLGLRSRS